ncbi:hypothetical protein QBC46DRAFT_338908 [Diplogelasinospora grovesii]|uniref:Uncharacterized protein n=1 Tax=Diplogelasinospora grovesii TaxID=303347 RepID=A0AAN6NCE3_9PEZI|nr:hypothetical protein QBC46DRAFT_338908 [Diplogelasinospora grovesii]
MALDLLVRALVVLEQAVSGLVVPDHLVLELAPEMGVSAMELVVLELVVLELVVLELVVLELVVLELVVLELVQPHLSLSQFLPQVPKRRGQAVTAAMAQVLAMEQAMETAAGAGSGNSPSVVPAYGGGAGAPAPDLSPTPRSPHPAQVTASLADRQRPASHLFTVVSIGFIFLQAVMLA